MSPNTFRIVLTATALAACALHVRADVVTDWNIKAGEIAGEAKLGTPPANRVMAIVQSAVFDAASAASKSRADAIPWLLLSAKSVGAPGRFAAVPSVQRIHTVGGTAPAKPCDASTLGQTERVPYTADYLLFAS